MKHLVKAAMAGFDEKNDVLVTVEPIASGIEVELKSKVERAYGKRSRIRWRESNCYRQSSLGLYD